MWPFKEHALERPEMFYRKFLIRLYNAQDIQVFETDLDVAAPYKEPTSSCAYEEFRKRFIHHSQYKSSIVTSEYEGRGRTFVEIDWSKVAKTCIIAHPRKGDWVPGKSYYERTKA